MVMVIIMTYCNDMFSYWSSAPTCLLVKARTMSYSCLCSQCLERDPGVIVHCPPRESCQCWEKFLNVTIGGGANDI